MEKPFLLTEFKDKFIIKKNSTNQELTIKKNFFNSGNSEKILPIFGLYGSITLKCSTYLICVTKANIVGQIEKNLIYEIKKVEFLKVKNSELENQEKGIKKMFSKLNASDSNELKYLKKFFKMPGHYFSEFELYDCKLRNGMKSFIFNFYAISNLQKIVEDSSFCSLKCIFGSFVNREIGGVRISLISKRSRHRIGVRFLSKGGDENGHVSNFVETTQIVEIDGKINSFVQIRGSIPLKWKNEIGLKYDPLYFIDEKSEEVFRKSDEILKSTYKSVLYLNLIKDVNYEEELCRQYISCLKKFDCSFLHFNISSLGLGKDKKVLCKLEEEIQKYLDNFGFFNENETQSGVIRTNCVDSTDRTNISQFIIGKYILKKQLSLLNTEFSKEIEDTFKKMYFINGNLLSIQYSGTPSVLSEIILEGINTRKGIYRDSYYSLKRYFINRWNHGDLFKAYQIITGKQTFFKRNLKLEFQKHFGFFLLVFIFVTMYKILLNKFVNEEEKIVSLVLAMFCGGYFVFNVEKYLDVPEYD